MQENTLMRPCDCQVDVPALNSISKVESRIMILMSNTYCDNSCLTCSSPNPKNGPECRKTLPREHKVIAQLYYDADNIIDWYFIDGTKRKVESFKYMPQHKIWGSVYEYKQ